VKEVAVSEDGVNRHMWLLRVNRKRETMLVFGEEDEYYDSAGIFASTTCVCATVHNLFTTKP